MKGIIDDSNRQVVPRCLDYLTACSLGLQRAIRRSNKEPWQKKISAESIKEWKESPDIDNAVDILAEALIIKNFESPEAIKAANFILEKAPINYTLIRELANHFLEPKLADKNVHNQIKTIDVSHENISNLKKSVRDYQLNAIAWVDLALCYATNGQQEKAKYAMRVALDLGKNNRFILRSASRCYMHLKDPERAIYILHKSELDKFDPWIASAEIAISESSGIKSKIISKAREMLQDDNFTNFSRSELAAGIGTLELKQGSVKRAKDFMRKAIVDPTENALAQAEWVTNEIGIVIPKIVQLGNKVPASYEMQTRYQYQKKHFKESLLAAKKWSNFQQLSTRPVIVSTFISSVCLDDNEQSINIIKDLLQAQRNDPSIINNYAFSLVKMGKVKEAEEELKKLEKYELSDVEKLVDYATKGLIAFRKGNPDEGRQLYSKAVNGFEKLRNPYTGAIASYFWAVEEKGIKSEYAEARVKEAKNKVKRYKVICLEELAEKL